MRTAHQNDPELKETPSNVLFCPLTKPQNYSVYSNLRQGKAALCNNNWNAESKKCLTSLKRLKQLISYQNSW